MSSVTQVSDSAGAEATAAGAEAAGGGTEAAGLGGCFGVDLAAGLSAAPAAPAHHSDAATTTAAAAFKRIFFSLQTGRHSGQGNRPAASWFSRPGSALSDKPARHRPMHGVT
ncbi:MAG: hypothetical protein HY020_09640 [Burkholderiales bacterium]|nr:hypothetical protein [Burkholderiales bacterium]